MFKAFISIGLWLSLFCSTAFADPEHIIHFDLSLGGYQLGMSYDEATLVRPFAIIEDLAPRPNIPEIKAGYVNQVYIDDIEFRFKVELVEDQVHKVIGRLAPADLDKLRQSLNQTLGQSEADAKVFTSSTGEEYHLYHDHWQFPDASLDLIGSELNTDYATLALTATSWQDRQQRAERSKRSQQAKSGAVE